MYVGRDFDPTDEGESEIYTLDFVKDMQPKDEITAAQWRVEVAAISENPDPDIVEGGDPGDDKRIGDATYAGTKTSQRIAGLEAGVTYCLIASVNTKLGDTLSLYSHVECRDPA